jgi:hypothetical protein
MLSRSLCLVALLAVTGAAAAQSNTTPGLDIRLFDTWSVQAFQRAGTYPTGVSAIGAWTTCCNPGSVRIPFMAAMNPNHGFIHYLVARESDGRFVQISDWSYVKHTFGSNNNNSTCGNCAGPGNFNYVEVGCSDTYANSQAVDHYWLGPPSEIDPWLGVWVPNCSYFDQGDPPVGPSQMCDGLRSLSQSQANVLNQTVHHQVQVHDGDFNVPGANFYWQAGYLVPSEGEATRGDNIGSRPFTATWNGSGWVLTDAGAFLQGSILQRWTGSALSSSTNGVDDGRFYVAVKVTGPVNGIYHYEYAVHNRDNKRGMGALHIPICPQAQAFNFGFHDVDQDPLDDWTASVANSEIVYTTTSNPERWNSVFNFWFDSDAGPVAGSTLGLDQFDIGPGALTVNVPSSAPLGLYNQYLGPGCGNPTAPSLFATGSPDHATLGNTTFGLSSIGNPAGAMCGFVLSISDGSTLLGPGCTLYSTSLNTVLPPYFVSASAGGTATMPLPVPTSTALEGTHIDFQMANIQSGGAFLANFNLSNGLRVRIGSALSTCP